MTAVSLTRVVAADAKQILSIAVDLSGSSAVSGITENIGTTNISLTLADSSIIPIPSTIHFFDHALLPQSNGLILVVGLDDSTTLTTPALVGTPDYTGSIELTIGDWIVDYGGGDIEYLTNDTYQTVLAV